jgi:hypothetical protein
MMRFVGPFLFIFLSAGLYFAGIHPGLEAINALNEQEKRIDSVLASSNNLKDRYERLYNTRASFSSRDTERLYTLTPDVVDPVRFVMSIDSLAQKNNILVKTFAVPSASQSKKNEKGYILQTFRFECEGTYTGIKNFLRDIEKSLTLMDIRQLTFSTIEEVSESGVLIIRSNKYIVNFSLDTYIFTGV